MGLTIQPLTAEEVEHRMTMAALFQRSTLAQLKTAAEGYAADLREGVKDGDPDAHIASMLDSYPQAGFTSKSVALRVHLARAERWLRGNEARVERERKLVSA